MDAPGYLYNNLASIGRWLLPATRTLNNVPIPDFDDPANGETLDILGKYSFIEKVTKKDYQSALIEELLSKDTRAQCYGFTLLCETSSDIKKS